MIAYATTTRTRKTVAMLRAAGWRLLITPDIHDTHGMPYGIDNGAWGAFQRQEPWDEGRFLRLVEAKSSGADWVVLPDIVAGGAASLERSVTWIPRLRGAAPLMLLPVQDGMSVADVDGLVARDVGLFVGGSTDWKLDTLPLWGAFARTRGLYLHVARVNTRRRIRLCKDAGAQSFDGTSVTRFSCTLDELDPEVRQRGFWQRETPPVGPGSGGTSARRVAIRTAFGIVRCGAHDEFGGMEC